MISPYVKARTWRVSNLKYLAFVWWSCVILMLYAAVSKFQDQLKKDKGIKQTNPWMSVSENVLIYKTFHDTFKIHKNMTKDMEVKQTDSWVSVTEKVFIYSAFHDTRGDKSVVKIVGIGPRTGTSYGDFKCVAEGPSFVFNLTTKFQILPEHHTAQNSAIFFVCHFKENEILEKVGLSYRENSPVWIRMHKEGFLIRNSSIKLSICIRPLYKDVFILPRVSEFIQAWKFLGASHFIFYDYKTPPEVKLLLQDLSRNGLASIEILPWNLPVPGNTIHCEGQLAFLQDCLYRTMSNYEWIAPVDLDEYMIPVQNISLLELLERHRRPNTAGYEVQHSLFCPDNFTEGLLTQSILHRHSKLGGIRNKCVYYSKNVKILGIHFPWSLIRGTKMINLRPEEILLNHYRILGAYKLEDCTVRDDRALRMADTFTNSDILESYRKIQFED